MQHNQVGFISGMPSQFNTQNLINIICHIVREKKENYMKISIDMEKALKKLNTKL